MRNIYIDIEALKQVAVRLDRAAEDVYDLCLRLHIAVSRLSKSSPEIYEQSYEVYCEMLAVYDKFCELSTGTERIAGEYEDVDSRIRQLADRLPDFSIGDAGVIFKATGLSSQLVTQKIITENGDHFSDQMKVDFLPSQLLSRCLDHEDWLVIDYYSNQQEKNNI